MGDLRGWNEVKWTEGRKDVRRYKTRSNMMRKRRGKGRGKADEKRQKVNE